MRQDDECKTRPVKEVRFICGVSLSNPSIPAYRLPADCCSASGYFHHDAEKCTWGTISLLS